MNKEATKVDFKQWAKTFLGPHKTMGYKEVKKILLEQHPTAFIEKYSGKIKAYLGNQRFAAAEKKKQLKATTPPLGGRKKKIEEKDEEKKKDEEKDEEKKKGEEVEVEEEELINTSAKPNNSHMLGVRRRSFGGFGLNISQESWRLRQAELKKLDLYLGVLKDGVKDEQASYEAMQDLIDPPSDCRAHTAEQVIQKFFWDTPFSRYHGLITEKIRSSLVGVSRDQQKLEKEFNTMKRELASHYTAAIGQIKLELTNVAECVCYVFLQDIINAVRDRPKVLQAELDGPLMTKVRALCAEAANRGESFRPSAKIQAIDPISYNITLGPTKKIMIEGAINYIFGDTDEE